MNILMHAESLITDQIQDDFVFIIGEQQNYSLKISGKNLWMILLFKKRK